MKTIGTFVVVAVLGVLTAGSARAAAPTFEDCQSAGNYGYNSAYSITSSVMNKAACGDTQVRKGEVALARQAKRQKIPAHNPHAHKVCFYGGYYEGYIDALVTEAGQCGATLELASVARAAAAVFTAMHEALLAIDDGVIDSVFDNVFQAPDLDLDDLADQCDEVIYDDAFDLEAGLDELVDSVCRND
jgi:hypothetical protein